MGVANEEINGGDFKEHCQWKGGKYNIQALNQRKGIYQFLLRNSKRSKGVRKVCGGSRGQEHKQSVSKGWPACCRGPGVVRIPNTIWSVRKESVSAKLCCLLGDGEASVWEWRQ